MSKNLLRYGVAIFWTAGHVEGLFEVPAEAFPKKIYYFIATKDTLSVRQAVSVFDENNNKRLKEINIFLFIIFLFTSKLFVPVSFYNSKFFVFLCWFRKEITMFPDSLMPIQELRLRKNRWLPKTFQSIELITYKSTHLNIPHSLKLRATQIDSKLAMNKLVELIRVLPETDTVWLLGKDRLSTKTYVKLRKYLLKRFNNNVNLIFFPHPRCKEWEEKIKTNLHDFNNLYIEEGYMFASSVRPTLVISLGTSVANVFYGISELVRFEETSASILKRGFSRTDLLSDEEILI